MIRPPARFGQMSQFPLNKIKGDTKKKGEGDVREERSGTAVLTIKRGAFTFALKCASKNASSISASVLLPAIPAFKTRISTFPNVLMAS